MLAQPFNIRYEQRTCNFNATTSLFSFGTLNALYNANLPQTWLALIRPTGAGESNFGYVASKVSPSSATGMRWIVDHNSGSPRMIFGLASGTTGPSQSAPVGTITYNRWVWVAATYSGGLAAANVKLYQGLHSISEVASYPAPVDGTGSIDNTSSYNYVVGNRDGGDRTFAGDIAMVVRWDAVLTRDELNAAIRYGPLSVRKKTILACFAGGQDISPHKLRTSTITARGLGRHYKYPVDRVSAPSWIAEIAGGLSAVQKDADLRWDILSAATKDADLRWDVLSAAQKDADLRWSIVTSLQKDVDLRWDLVSAILKDVDIRWDIESASTVVKDVELRWSILNSLLKDADFRWNVLEAVQKDSSLIWNLLSAVSKDADLRWDILSALTAVSKDVDIRWSLIASAVKDLDARWDILTSVSKDETLIWDIAIAAVRDIDLRWDISAGLGVVTKDSTFMWAVMNAAQKDITLQWVIQTVAGPEIKSRYIYVLPEEGRVFVLRPENFH